MCSRDLPASRNARGRDSGGARAPTTKSEGRRGCPTQLTRTVLFVLDDPASWSAPERPSAERGWRLSLQPRRGEARRQSATRDRAIDREFSTSLRELFPRRRDGRARLAIGRAPRGAWRPSTHSPPAARVAPIQQRNGRPWAVNTGAAGPAPHGQARPMVERPDRAPKGARSRAEWGKKRSSTSRALHPRTAPTARAARAARRKRSGRPSPTRRGAGAHDGLVGGARPVARARASSSSVPTAHRRRSSSPCRPPRSPRAALALALRRSRTARPRRASARRRPPRGVRARARECCRVATRTRRAASVARAQRSKARGPSASRALDLSTS